MTTLNEQIMTDLKEAMKNKETLKKGVLTLIRAALTNAEKEKKAALTTEEEVAIVQRELKQTKQSLTEGEKAGRTDIVESELAKINIIEAYLPEMMSADDIVAFLTEKGVQKGTNIGQVMGILMKEKKGQVDGTLAREVIQKHFV